MEQSEMLEKTVLGEKEGKNRAIKAQESIIGCAHKSA